MIRSWSAGVARAAALALGLFALAGCGGEVSLPTGGGSSAASDPSGQTGTAGNLRFPALTGRVVDQAGILEPATEAELDRKLADLEARTTDQVVVATVPSLEGYEIEEYGYQLGRAWKIGQAEQNNGVILLVAPAEKRVRIEVGYGLEPVLTDALSSVIIHQKILPRFRQGDMPGGIVAGTDAVIEQLTIDRGEAVRRASLAGRELPAQAKVNPEVLFVALIVMFFVLSSLMRALGGGRRRRRHHMGVPIIFWGGGGGGWGGGGGFGGGGFGGGGGSFGGGGASGGW
ncbi:MAG TPA: TPM domain-containing protein [Caulobacteraceae bacterium]|nr:TPM domain-containing protein [Caulobacteraceae bacterium]